MGQVCICGFIHPDRPQAEWTDEDIRAFVTHQNFHSPIKETVMDHLYATSAYFRQANQASPVELVIVLSDRNVTVLVLNEATVLNMAEDLLRASAAIIASHKRSQK